MISIKSYRSIAHVVQQNGFALAAVQEVKRLLFIHLRHHQKRRRFRGFEALDTIQISLTDIYEFN